MLIGKATPRLDTLAKSNGTAQFTQDIQLPDMLVTTVIYPPRFGGTVKSFDAAAAKAVPGVIDVVQFQDADSRRRGRACEGLLHGEEGPRRRQGGVG